MKTFNSHEYITYKTQSLIPSMRYDGSEDFAGWQKKARKKLEELLGLPFEKCEDDKFEIVAETQMEKYKHVEFTFQSEEGYYVACDLLVPNGLTKPLPGVICLQGHSTGKHISVAVPKFPCDPEDIAGGRDFAVRAVEEGFCAIAMEQRYMGGAGQDEKTGDPSCITRNEGMATLLLGRTAIGERVWDVSRLIDVIEKHLTAYIDASCIICMGNSGGGTATFYASCMEERISLAMPSCALCTYEDSIMAMKHCACNFIPGIRKYFDMGDLGGLIAPRPYVTVSGVEDPIFPIHGVEKTYEITKAIYDHVGKGDLYQLVRGQGGHRFYPDDAWPVAKRLLKDTKGIEA